MNPSVWDLIRPILAENGGWAAFIYTPRGRNHGWKMLEMAQKNPRWFAQVLTVDDTKSVPMDAIEEDRASGMSEPMIQQEYWCSFDAPLEGSWYGDYMVKAVARKAGSARCPGFPKCRSGPAGTSATATPPRSGSRSSTAPAKRGSSTTTRPWARAWSTTSRTSSERDYIYAGNLLPHDAGHTELGTGKTKNRDGPQDGPDESHGGSEAWGSMDGINAVRAMLPHCYFDEEHTELGVQALREYLKKESGLVDPEGNKLYLEEPMHTWASHGADAIRTIAVGMRPPQQKRPRLAPEAPNRVNMDIATAVEAQTARRGRRRALQKIGSTP